MLKGAMDNIAWREGLPQALRQMLDRLADPALRKAQTGRSDLDGGAFFVINAYDTQPAGALHAESHRRYCDVQVILHGSEQIGWAALASDLDAPYDAAKDVSYYAPGLPLDWHAFGPGDVFIFAPSDIHLPGVTLSQPARIRKVVGKLPWAELAGDWPPAS